MFLDPKIMCRLTALMLVVAILSGCGPSVTTFLDDRLAFTIDSSKPFRIEFGRGSGWHGLDTITINEAGSVVLHRQTSTGWETASFALSRSELKAILESLDENRIMNLMRAYHQDGVADGTQWVFWVTQGVNEKSVYFNNHFPNAIRAFASDLDSQIRGDVRQLDWTVVPEMQIRDHEKDLWESIKTRTERIR